MVLYRGRITGERIFLMALFMARLLRRYGN